MMQYTIVNIIISRGYHMNVGLILTLFNEYNEHSNEPTRI